MTRNHTCHCCGQVTDRAMSTAPVVALLRILELCWRARHALPADVVERIREQLEGPAGDRARADMAVLDAMAAMPDDVLVWAPKHAVSASLDEACRAELARRGAAEPDRLTAAARRAFVKAETGAHWQVLATRTEAERRVLDAAAAIHPRALVRPLSYTGDWEEFCEAELARREEAR